jgi:hypothetical protein
VEQKGPEPEALMQEMALLVVPPRGGPVGEVDLNDARRRARERLSRGRREGPVKRGRFRRSGRLGEERLGPVVGQERLDLGAEVGVAPARPLERRLPLGRGQRLDGEEDLFDASVSGGVHRFSRLRAPGASTP